MGPKMTTTYRIRELGKEFGLTARALRFYEDKGIVRPKRAGTSRVYSERDRTRLKLALRGKRLGFTLDECREIIDLYDPRRTNNAAQTLRLFEKICEHRRVLLAKLEDLQATLEAMNQLEAQCVAALGQAAGERGRAGTH